MRVFTGIELPLEVKDQLYKIQKNIGPKYAKIKWVEKKNLHITLKFFGEVNETEVKELKQKLSKIKIKPFKLKLKDLGSFPEESTNISVVWVGLNKSQFLYELQKEIDSETMEYKGDFINYNPHITLGRVKLIKNKKELINRIKNINVEELEFNVGSFTFFLATLSKDGPNYEIIERYSLV